TASNDTVDGGGGNDTIVGGGDGQLLQGGAGNDSITLSAGTEYWSYFATIAGGDGDDTIDLGQSISNAIIDGSAGDDTFLSVSATGSGWSGDSGHNLTGGEGQDTYVLRGISNP